MRISLTIPNNHRVKALLQPWQDEVGGPQIAEVAALADRLGYRRLTVAEHFLIPAEHVGLSGPHHLHAVTSLAYLAGVTSRIRLASNVTILPLGVDFTTRGRRLDECVEAMRRIWTSDLASYDGEFFRFHEIAAEPKPRQPGGVALWFAGDVPQTFARVARWGVGWSPYLLPPTRIAEGLDRIRSHPGYHGQHIGVRRHFVGQRQVHAGIAAQGHEPGLHAQAGFRRDAVGGIHGQLHRHALHALLIRKAQHGQLRLGEGRTAGQAKGGSEEELLQGHVKKRAPRRGGALPHCLG